MDTKPEMCLVNYRKTEIPTRKHTVSVISISIGGMLGLLLFAFAITVDMTTILQPSIDVGVANVDAVSVCKEGIIKYAPLGAYPGGQDQVKSAFAYCNSLA